MDEVDVVARPGREKGEEEEEKESEREREKREENEERQGIEVDKGVSEKRFAFQLSSVSPAARLLFPTQPFAERTSGRAREERETHL